MFKEYQQFSIIDSLRAQCPVASYSYTSKNSTESDAEPPRFSGKVFCL